MISDPWQLAVFLAMTGSEKIRELDTTDSVLEHKR